MAHVRGKRGYFCRAVNVARDGSSWARLTLNRARARAQHGCAFTRDITERRVTKSDGNRDNFQDTLARLQLTTPAAHRSRELNSWDVKYRGTAPEFARGKLKKIHVPSLSRESRAQSAEARAGRRVRSGVRGGRARGKKSHERALWEVTTSNPRFLERPKRAPAFARAFLVASRSAARSRAGTPRRRRRRG